MTHIGGSLNSRLFSHDEAMSDSISSESPESGLAFAQRFWRAVSVESASMNRDVLVSSALLLLSLAFALHKLLKRPPKASTPKIDWEAKAKEKKPITSRIQGISDETIRDWNKLRMCDVTNVWVSNILVHPIKSCRGTSVQEAVFTPEGIEVSICFKISTCHSKILMVPLASTTENSL